ncbi:uncharacterized protein JCM6883_005377 [Sporobolomyces salmoneus]|uniref:uncharacterized protein n=1 Tax=Sporobolomyces salmoneus TaxID=183962 RepID=UPI00317D6860
MPGVNFYLTPARLRRLDSLILSALRLPPSHHYSEYSYSAVDKSPLSNYVMRHWWVWTASFAPPWLAPNAITLLGFAAILLNFATVWIFVGDLVGPGGWWVYASCAVGLFWYQTMDNIDGKQARRTGTSSPLGELFDHGLDTLNCPIGGLIQAAAMGLGQSKYAVLCILVPCWSMFVSTWKEFHTGTLYLGYINGPVEGVLIAVGILVVSAIKGPGFWALTVSETIGDLPLVPSSTQLLDLMMLFLTSAFFVAHLPLCLLNVHSILSPPMTRRPLTSPRPTPRRNPSTTTGQAFAQLLPIIGFSVLTVMWTFSPKSRILRDGYLEEFALIVCFLFGQLSSKIILAQLTRGPFPFSWSLLVPLLIPAISINTPYLGLPSLLPPSLEPLYLHLTLLFSLLTYSRAVHLILDGFCSYLGIKALTIPFPNKAVEGWEPLPTRQTPRQQQRRTATQDEEERELELEMERLGNTSANSPTKRNLISSSLGTGGGQGGGGTNLLKVVPSPFKNLLNSVGGGEGRKRSNTSERERGNAGTAAGSLQGEGRRLAQVSPVDR